MFSKFFLNLQQYNLTLSLHGKNHTMVLLTVCFLWQQAECLRFICSISWSCIEASGCSIPIVDIPVWLWSNLNKSLAHLKVPTTDRGKWNAYVSPGIHCVALDGLSLTNHTRMLPMLGMQVCIPTSSWAGFSWILSESVGKVSWSRKGWLKLPHTGVQRRHIKTPRGEGVRAQILQWSLRSGIPGPGRHSESHGFSRLV